MKKAHDERRRTGLVGVPLLLKGRDPIHFDVSVTGKEPACFALSIRKCGSSIFSNIVAAIAKRNQRHVIDIPASLFRHNVPYPEWSNSGALAKLVWRGNVYVGFRDMPSSLVDDAIFADARKI